MSEKQETATAGLESERAKPRQLESQEPRNLKVFDRLKAHQNTLVAVTLTVLFLSALASYHSCNGLAKPTEETKIESENEQDSTTYTKRFGKVYENEAEMIRRMSIFLANKQRIQAENGAMIEFLEFYENGHPKCSRALSDKEQEFVDIISGKIYDNIEEAYRVGCMG